MTAPAQPVARESGRVAAWRPPFLRSLPLRLSVIAICLLWTIPTMGLLVIWAFACYRVYQGVVTVGVLTAFLAYVTRFYGRIESMLRMGAAVQRASASAQRIFEILDRRPSVPDPVKPVHPGRLRGKVELRDVRFRYGTREVLHGITCEAVQAKAGQQTTDLRRRGKANYHVQIAWDCAVTRVVVRMEDGRVGSYAGSPGDCCFRGPPAQNG